MFKRLRVQNFRSIRDSGDLQFSRLNIIVGANNSGKSSLLYALLLFKQTLEDKDSRHALVTCGPHIDLGSYLHIVRGNDPKGELGLELELDEKLMPMQEAIGSPYRKLKPLKPFNKYQIKFRFETNTNTIAVNSFSVGSSTSNSSLVYR